MKIFSIIVLVLGILGVILGVLVTGVSLALPEFTSGRTSWDEAMIGIIGGAVVLVISFIMFVAGLVMLFIARKKAKQG